MRAKGKEDARIGLRSEVNISAMHEIFEEPRHTEVTDWLTYFERRR